MATPISIFLNKVEKFFPSDFMEFTRAFKKSHQNLQVVQSKDDNMYYGFFKGDSIAQFKYDKDSLKFYTDLSSTQVFDLIRKAK